MTEYVINPESNKAIRVGGRLYNRLKKLGKLKRTQKPKPKEEPSKIVITIEGLQEGRTLKSVVIETKEI